MIFDENNSNMITILNPKRCSTFIYFLLDNMDVVYVGQTTKGLLRPLVHTDKKYDTVKIIPCNRLKLDDVEREYIIKYTPKYNERFNYDNGIGLLKLRRLLKLETLTDIKQFLSQNDIKYFKRGSNYYANYSELLEKGVFTLEQLKELK